MLKSCPVLWLILTFSSSALAAEVATESLVAIDGVRVDRTVNDWVVIHHRRLSPESAKPAALAEEADRVSAALSLRPADRSAMKRFLQETFDLRLDQVYAPASGPFFTNGKGLVWSRAEGKWYLQIRESDGASCRTALVDLTRPRVVHSAPIPCTVR